MPSLPRLPDVCPWVMGRAASLPEHRGQGASEHPRGGGWGWGTGGGNVALDPECHRPLLGLSGPDSEGYSSIPGTADHFQSRGQRLSFCQEWCL